MRFVDRNFHRGDGHILRTSGQRVPTRIYSYETKTKLYDIIVVDDDSGSFFCRVNSRKCDASAVHHEIDKFYNLGLKLL